ncbi:MAG: amidohydrolase family protein [Thermoanaerobaculia bacterium]
MRTLVRNGRVASEGRVETTDLLLEDGRVSAVGRRGLGPADRVVEAAGCWVLPGLVDFHVHVGDRIGRFELADDYESGTRAAVKNGVTTLCTFVTQGPGESLGAALRRTRARAEGQCHADVAWHLTPTRFESADWAEMEELVGAGYRTFKLYTTYRGAGLFSDQARLEELFHRLGPLGVRFLLHCEDDALLESVDASTLDLSKASAHARLRPEAAEVASVEALLALAARCAVPLHVVHVSTVAAAERIRDARESQDVTSETCPQYLWLDEGWLDRPDGHRWLCSPPLRGGRARFRELARGGAFDFFATDHCAFRKVDKDDWDGRDVRTAANGLPGVGGLLHHAWRLWGDDPDRAAREVSLRLSKNPAARLGLDGRKGALRPGLDADVVVLDPNGPERPVRGTESDAYDAFPGFTSTLALRHVLVHGEPVVADGALLDAERRRGQLHPISE